MESPAGTGFADQPVQYSNQVSSSPMPKLPKTRGRPNSREAMLDAAQDVVLEGGAGKLTLDAVAKRAGVSKGGVMYNFPTKEALLKAMVERLVEHNRHAHAQVTASLPDRPGRSLKAYVMNSVRALDVDDRVSGALLAALNSDRNVLAPVAEYFNGRFAKLAQDVPFEQAALVYLATEGLWTQELLQLSPFTPRQRARVVRMLVRMAEQEAAVGTAARAGKAAPRTAISNKERKGKS
ncbi:TetR/AcrR family transcriptional regulator [Nevskia soli]|uniref:TetR/AcrR family transcriptional regulator n=1 Tax=Nevskia soli TaxID=418856 RepID=UPI000B2544E2|nr:TetR/AcrR family transcriptional regulator [Nevskia soli]